VVITETPVVITVIVATETAAIAMKTVIILVIRQA
jgi:hypothetical protein